jgi:hypothetical protein
MRQAALLVALACLVVAPLAGAAGAAPTVGAATTADVAGSSSPQLQDQALDREGVHVAVQLDEDGDAQWNVSATYRLDDENETVAFDQLAAAFKAGQTDNGFSVGVFEAAAPGVSERVGRSMEIADARRTATTVEHANNSTGVLTLQFTWTNFAAVENETLTVDGFSGTWFGDLRDGQRLSIRPPEEYDPDTVEPNTNVVDGAYQWEGPQAFQPGEPSLVFTSTPEPAGGFPVVVVAGVVAVVAALVLAAWAYSRSELSTPASDEGGAGVQTPEPADGATAQRESSAETGDRTAGGAVDATVSGTGDGQATGGDGQPAGGDGGSGGGVDPELLSDEERVEKLLADHGGRMKQSKIVEETRWSTAKVSQLLSSMDDEDRVEKLRIGRENLISLPGEGFDDDE